MAEILGKDYLYLIWKDPKTRKQFRIGKLVKNGGYEFKYDLEINDALKAGFLLIPTFPDTNKTYTRKDLFPAFACRLPDKSRPEIKNILSKYDMDEYDEYELLKRSGARTLSDSFEFINPILSLDDKEIKRHFRIAGSRHYAECKGNCCEMLNCYVGESLLLEKDPNNEYDPYAIKIKNSKDEFIGYIPRYFSESVSELLNKGYSCSLKVKHINANNDCSNCIYVDMILKDSNNE